MPERAVAQPSGADPTVSAGYARNLQQFAVSRGVDPERLSALSGVSIAELEDMDARIPMAGYMAMMRAAKSLSGDPALALHAAAAADFREFSVVGLICYAARTMGEALAELNRYGHLVADVDLAQPGGRFQVVARDGALWLVDMRRDAGAFPELTEATWARFIAETRRHFPDAAFALAVHVTHPRPDHANAYDAVLGVPVTFSAAWNAIQIDTSWLSLQLHNPSDYARDLLSARADTLADQLLSSKSLRGRLEALLKPVLHKGDLDMAAAAAELAMSRASLYRALKAEGVTYEGVVDDLRRRVALHLLNGRSVSIAETAYLVGFSDPSAFSRAFKRWTGVSPRERRLQAPGRSTAGASQG